MCDVQDDKEVTASKHHCLICDCPAPPASAQLTHYNLTAVNGLINLLRTKPTVDIEDRSFELQLNRADYCPQCIQDLEDIYAILGQLEELKVKVVCLVRASHRPVAARRSEQQRENLRAEILRKVDEQDCQGSEFRKEYQGVGYDPNFMPNGSKCLRLLPVARELLEPDPLSLQMVALRNVQVEVKIEPEMQEWGPEEGSGGIGMDLENEHKDAPRPVSALTNNLTSLPSLKTKPKSSKPYALLGTGKNSRRRKMCLKNLMKARVARDQLRFKKLTSQSTEVSIKTDNANSMNTKTDGANDDGNRNPAESIGVEIILCRVCGERLPNGTRGMKARETHRNTAHPGLQFGKGTCNICQTGHRHGHLEYHYVTVHETEFKCHTCQSEFNNFLEYYHHRTTHPELNLPPVKCEECGRIFKQNRHLVGHVEVFHSKNPPVTCDRPGCKFVCGTEHGLSRHVKAVHEGLRPLACQICPRRFACAYSLRIHVLRHEGKEARNRVCPEPGCGKAFSLPCKLRDHCKAVHGAAAGHGNAHICDICGKSFPIFNYLYIHLRSHETPEEKKMRRLKAEQAREERRQSGLPILVPKGRPRIRPIKPTRGGKGGKRCSTAADLADPDQSMAEVLVQERQQPSPDVVPSVKDDSDDHVILPAEGQQNDSNEHFQAIDNLLREMGTN